jgi:hypothetical protein
MIVKRHVEINPHEERLPMQIVDFVYITDCHDSSLDVTPAIKHINGRGGACSAQSGRGKQRPYIMGCDV